MDQSFREPSSHTTMCFSHPKRMLVIMAKAPKLGMVKTRLTESLPSPAVTALYRCLLEDTLALATSLTGVEIAVMCPASDQDELAQLLGNTVQVVAQEGEGLAAGLTSVFRHFTATGQQHVIAFNSDSPHLAPSVLNAMTCCWPVAVKCRKTEVRPAARPSPSCATTCTVLPNICANSFLSDSAPTTAIYTPVNDVANAMVSSKRQRYRAVTAREGRLSVS